MRQIFFCFFLLLLLSCSSGKEQILTGSWTMINEDEEIVFVFDKDGTFSRKDRKGTAIKWRLAEKDKETYLILEEDGNSSEMRIVKLNGKELIIGTSRGEIKFTKNK